MKNFFYLFLLFLTLRLTSIAGDTTTVVILYTNDMHGHIDEFSPMASYVQMFREKYENVFLFSAGDLFTGNPVVDQYQEPGYPIIDVMNRVHYDVSTIGNHEFDYGQLTLLNRTEQANFPFICANMEITPKCLLDHPKSMVAFYTKDSLKILVLGLIQVGKNNMPDTYPPKIKNIKFYDPIKTAKKYKSYADSCNVFIALTHLGINTDKILAEKNPFFDVIIGGHSHTTLPNGINVGNVLITQSGYYMKNLGVLSLKLVNGKLVSKQDSLISLKMGIACNYEISQLVFKYNETSPLNDVIGIAMKDISGSNELGALMTDAIREKMNVDIAFQNIGGIRVDKIPAGNITSKQLYKLSPFGNTYVRYTLTVNQIKSLIKYAFNLEHQNEIEVSGITIKLLIDNEQKLKNVELFDLKGNLLTKKKFTVAINNYMAKSYTLGFLKKGDFTELKDAETTADYIKNHYKLNYSGVKRITIVKE